MVGLERWDGWQFGVFYTGVFWGVLIRDVMSVLYYLAQVKALSRAHNDSMNSRSVRNQIYTLYISDLKGS